MVNTSKLQGLMRERKQTLNSLARLMGKSKTSVFDKIHGKREFLCSEMQTIRTTLNMSDEEFKSIFFA